MVRVLVTSERGCVEKQNGIWEGFCVKILDKLSHKLKITTEYVESKSQSYDVMINTIAAGEADFSINRFYILPKREEKVDFIKPLASGYIKALGKMTETSPLPFLRFLHPFTLESWLIFVAFVVSFILALVFANYSSKSHQKFSKKVDTITRKLSNSPDTANRNGKQTWPAYNIIVFRRDHSAFITFFVRWFVG
jgi:hypothetical protein